MINKMLIIPGFLALLLGGCDFDDHDDDEHKDDEHELLELDVTTPLRRSSTLIKEYVSQIHAFQHIELRALEKGYLQSTFVDEGQIVAQGQAMFKIMPNIYQAELDKAEAEANVARIEYQNTKALASKDIVSVNELSVAQARLDKALAEVNLARTHLEFTDIAAPFAGMMDHLEVRNGSLLDEGELLTTLSDISKMWVYFNVPEAEYLNYRMTQTNFASAPVKLKLANGMVFPHEGRVEAIEADFDNSTGNIKFRATFPNPEQILRHGQTGNVLMDVPYPDALVIPQKATYEVLDQIYVFVVNAENAVEQRRIKVAAELPHVFLVSDGLAEADRILIEGLRRVSIGQHIEPDFEEPMEVLSQLDLYAE